MLNHTAADVTEKNKEMPIRWSCWRIGIIALVSVSGCSILFAAFWVYLEWTGSVKPALAIEYIPTAQYLLENPQLNTGDFDAILEIDDYQICVVTLSRIRYKGDVFGVTNFRMIVNEQQVGQNNIVTYWNGLHLPADARFCFINSLEEGLHLIEFRHAQAVYKWAIEIEAD
jgi:hypothetical protein